MIKHVQHIAVMQHKARVPRGVVEHAGAQGGIIVQRPQALQNLFHQAAIEQKLALIGHDHSLRLRDASIAGEHPYHAAPAHRSARGIVDIVLDDLRILLAIHYINGEVGLKWAFHHPKIKTAHGPVDRSDKAADGMAAINLGAVINIEAHGDVELFHHRGAAPGTVIFQAEDGAVEAIKKGLIRKAVLGLRGEGQTKEHQENQHAGSGGRRARVLHPTKARPADHRALSFPSPTCRKTYMHQVLHAACRANRQAHERALIMLQHLFNHHAATVHPWLISIKGGPMPLAQRKAFRIEASLQGQPLGGAHGSHGSYGAAIAPGGGQAGSADILEAIAELKEMIAPAQELNQSTIDNFHKDMAEVKRLEAEMSAIRAAIQQTKTEIATLHHSGFQGKELGKVTDELDAVVDGTEQATEAILTATETIEDRVGSLSAKLEGDDQGMANDAAEAVMTIFEACNFQDITGQRITKVVKTMRFIEERIDSMMDIWGGMESFEEVQTLDVAPKGDQALLNGPAMAEDTNVASQDDIDALFD